MNRETEIALATTSEPAAAIRLPSVESAALAVAVSVVAAVVVALSGVGAVPAAALGVIGIAIGYFATVLTIVDDGCGVVISFTQYYISGIPPFASINPQ